MRFQWLFAVRLCLLLLPVLPLPARDLRYSYISLSLEEGLSQPNVTAILSDRKGSLWIGTKNGLNRMDGQEIRTYAYDEDGSACLPDNWINGLAEGPDGTLWILRSFGLSRYLPLQDAFETAFDRPVYSSTEYQGEMVFGGDGILLWFHEGKQEPEKVRPFGTAPEYEDISYRILRIVDIGEGEKCC